jgi:type III secretion protein J
MQGTMFVPRLFSSSIVSTVKLFLFALLASLLLTGCEGSTTIVNELDERDANEIIVFLTGYQVTAEKIANAAGAGGGATTWNVAVKSSEKMKALTLLNNNGLPRRRSQNLLNLFQKQGLVSSELEEKIRYQAGLGEQIASTVRKIDGILDADIQISFPQEESLPGQSKKPELITAAVYVKHQGVLDNPNSHLILKIKQLVSSSIPGLNFDNVTVVADRAVFNDPMSLALKNEPVIVSVWGIRVLREYASHLQMLFFGLVSVILLVLVALVWLIWKISRILPIIGGFKSLFSAAPWALPGQKEADSAANKEAGAGGHDDANATETPVDGSKA